MHELKTVPGRKCAIHPMLLACGLAAGFLLWGLFLFATVGVKWPPAWDFGALPDVPGLSAYSSSPRRPPPGVPGLSPQHVRERPSFVETVQPEKEATP